MDRNRALRLLLITCILFVAALMPAAAQERQLPPTGSRGVVRFEGEVKSRPSESTLGDWVVGSRTITVVEQTMIDETKGAATVGAQVWVVARPLANVDTARSKLEAILIRVIGPEWSSRVVVVRGIVLEKQTDFFVINGMRILYDSSTPGAGDLEEGALVMVWATRTSEGVKAQRIRLLANPLPIVEFEGVIKRVSRELWVVGTRRVRLNEATVVDGTPLAGATARVRGYGQRNGVVLALVITIVAQPQTVEWTGRIDRLPPTITIWPPVYAGRWVVGGREFWATAETVVTGTPRIGAQAHVVALPRKGRALTAVKIKVLTLTD